MGVFSITPRSKQLGNIQGGSVRRVNIPNYHIGSGSAEMWRAAGRLGRDIMSAGKDMAYIAGDMRREQRMIQDAETETAFVDAMRSKMEDPANGLLGRVRTAGNSEALQGCVTEGQDYFRTAAEELLKDKGYSGDRKQKMLMRLKEAASPFQRAMAHGVLAKTQELKVSAADRNFNTLLETWKSNMTDEDATRAAIDSYRASQRARGLSDDTVEINTDKILRGMASDFALLQFGTLPTEKAVDDQIEVLKTHSKSLLGGNGVLASHFSSREPFDENTIRSLRGRLEERRREIHVRDEKLVSDSANLGIVAVAAIRDENGNYPKDRLPTIERSIADLQNLTARLPKGSRAAALAATQASDLNAKADMIAQQEMIDEYLNELKTNPKAKIYAPETKNEKGEVSPARNAYIGSGRKERLAPMVQQMVDQQRQSGSDAQARKANFANWKLKMLNGAKNPGEYHNEIFKAAEKGELTLDEYMKLKSEFDSSWAQGFVPGQKSPKQLAAEGMLGVVQEFFPNEELAASYEWDSKIGGLKMKKDAKYSGLEYEIHDRSGFWRGLGDLLEVPPTSTTHKMGPDMVEKIVNVATALSFYDGQQIDFDPITGKDVDFFTGEKIKTGKDAPKFSATNYFKQYLGRLKDEYKAIEAAEYVMQLVEAERNISGSFTDLEDTRRTAIGNAAKDAEKKSVTIRNRKTGEGVTTKK